MLKRNLHQTLLGILTISVLLSCNLISAKDYLLDLTKSTIYVDAKADKIKQFAAQELQKHLNLITGEKIPIVHSKQALKGNRLSFMIGVVPKSKKSKKLKPEMANYMYDARHKRLYLWGDDRITSRYKTPCASSRNRTGTLSAVYDFLRFELGVKWIKPGDTGIVYQKQRKLSLKHNDYSWAPAMLFSGARIEAWRQRVLRQCYATTPPKLRVTAAFLTKKYNEDMIWQRRMKFSNARMPEYQHAFTRYWSKYGKSHPEWFALGKNGKRGVAAGQRASYLKLCVTNPELLDTIVAGWKQRWEKDKSYDIYNACPNDSQGYCRCKKCCALDVKAREDKRYAANSRPDSFGITKKQQKGDTFETDSKSDRYVYFWNELLKRARRFNPQAKVIVYIYADYRYAPRKQILSDGIICGFVPRFMDRPAATKKAWAQWKKMGMNEVFLRPNDFNDCSGLPMGNSKYIYDKFSLSKPYKLAGMDYDRAYNHLDNNINGLAIYILSQARLYPEKSYNELANEFFATFGNAKADISKFYRYWVKLFETKRLPDIAKAAGFEGRDYLYEHLGQYYQLEDFVITQKILHKALKKAITPRVRRNIESLILSNMHARLIYLAITTNVSQASDEKKRVASLALYTFRVANRVKLSGSLMLLSNIENSFSDIAGIKRYVTAVPKGKLITLPYRWKFKIDEKDIGLQQKWQNLSWQTINKNWNELEVNAIWERQKSYPTPALAKKLKKYDGIGWYAIRLKKRPELKGKKVNLLFGAVDESCWIYINGKAVGKHLFIKADDWKTPFTIPINANALAENDQTVVVRVEDKAGAGGIWKPVSLQVLP
jgi:uncharacterized protein DUF4838/glycosyl hydrolase family 2